MADIYKITSLIMEATKLGDDVSTDYCVALWDAQSLGFLFNLTAVSYQTVIIVSPLFFPASYLSQPRPVLHCEAITLATSFFFPLHTRILINTLFSDLFFDICFIIVFLFIYSHSLIICIPPGTGEYNEFTRRSIKAEGILVTPDC